MPRLLIACLIAMLSACGGGGDDDDDPTTSTTDATPDDGRLGFVNAIADAPVLTFSYVGSFSGAGDVPLDFAQAQTFIATAGGYDVVVSYTKPNGELAVLFELTQELDDSDIEVTQDEERILVVAGELDSPTFLVVENVEYQNGVELPTDGTVLTTDPEVQFAHAVSDTGEISFYFTEAGCGHHRGCAHHHTRFGGVL